MQTFLLVSDIDVEKIEFFNVKLILFMNNFYIHIFRNSHLQMLFKISALKNFAILEIIELKRDSNIGVFV